MCASKKLRWTADALVARFVVLAADGHVHPDMHSHPLHIFRREGEKHDEESFPSQSPGHDCKRVVFFNRSGTGSGKHWCRSPHPRSTNCSGGDGCWERSCKTSFGCASDGSSHSAVRSPCSAGGYPSPTSRPASARSASHTFDHWPAVGTPPCHLRGRPLRQTRCKRPPRRFGHMDRKLRAGR